MARPHMMFVQSQDLLWHSGLPGGARPEVGSRTLSIDWDSTFAPQLPSEFEAIARPGQRVKAY